MSNLEFLSDVSYEVKKEQKKVTLKGALSQAWDKEENKPSSTQSLLKFEGEDGAERMLYLWNNSFQGVSSLDYLYSDPSPRRWVVVFVERTFRSKKKNKDVTQWQPISARLLDSSPIERAILAESKVALAYVEPADV